MFEARTAEAPVEDMGGYEEPRAPRAQARPPQVPAEPAYARSDYAPSRHRHLIPIIVAAYLIGLWAIVQFDGAFRHHPPHRLQIQLVPLDVVPPSKASPPPKQAVAKVQTPIIAPPPIVQNPIASPQPVVSAPIPAPPAPPAAAPAPAAPVIAVAAPIVPPDGMAANLGNPAPRYPMESRRQREEGTVRLRVLISAQGAVEEIAVAKSSGFDRLDTAALEAVRKWRFRPGLQAGTPVEATGFLSIPFRLTH